MEAFRSLLIYWFILTWEHNLIIVGFCIFISFVNKLSIMLALINFCSIIPFDKSY